VEGNPVVHTNSRRHSFAIMKKDNLTVLSEFLHKRENIDPARVTREATLEELKVDSLLLLELLFEFEDRLGVKIPEDIPRPTTVGDLLGIVDKLTDGKGV
jgi:acyl carrier protein